MHIVPLWRTALPISSLHSRLARAGTGLGVREIAFLADVSPETITRIEKSESVKPVTLEKVAAIYRFLGVIFIDDAEKPGLMVDMNRLSAVKSGRHDAEFVDLRGGSTRGQLTMLGTFLRVVESGRKWAGTNWAAH